MINWIKNWWRKRELRKLQEQINDQWRKNRQDVDSLKPL